MSDELIESFVAVTNASTYLAQQYLERNGNDLTAAIEDYYVSSGNEQGILLEPDEPRSERRAAQGGVRTLRDLDESEADDATNANLFTGGEKSALQVENPDKDKERKGARGQRLLVESIFQRARDQMNEPAEWPQAAPEQRDSHFGGSGFKLGDTTQQLEVVAPAGRAAAAAPEVAMREITFWRQGFTVGDGALQRYDDPANERVLEELKHGRVPVKILGVEFGQNVEVSVVRKTDEDYVPPKRKLGGFHGSGQRLGLPVPGESPVPVPEEPVAATPPPESQGEGDATVQIRFANGKRVSHKFHSSDPITAVYAFVREHAHNAGSTRPFVLSHAFPVKPIDELLEVTVEDAKLKNAVVVQRWQ